MFIYRDRERKSNYAWQRLIVDEIETLHNEGEFTLSKSWPDKSEKVKEFITGKSSQHNIGTELMDAAILVLAKHLDSDKELQDACKDILEFFDPRKWVDSIKSGTIKSEDFHTNTLTDDERNKIREKLIVDFCEEILRVRPDSYKRAAEHLQCYSDNGKGKSKLFYCYRLEARPDRPAYVAKSLLRIFPPNSTIRYCRFENYMKRSDGREEKYARGVSFEMHGRVYNIGTTKDQPSENFKYFTIEQRAGSIDGLIMTIDGDAKPIASRIIYEAVEEIDESEFEEKFDELKEKTGTFHMEDERLTPEEQEKCKKRLSLTINNGQILGDKRKSPRKAFMAIATYLESVEGVDYPAEL